MTALHDIPIQFESSAQSRADRGNALPILHEIRHALERLIDTGECTQIDLNAIPFGPGDETHLMELLGTGEVHATIDALGQTLIRESAIPGVWLVDYRNEDAERLALHIEITAIPEILRTQTEDLSTATATLDARLNPGQSGVRLQS